MGANRPYRIVAGLSAAAGGLLLAVLGQLAAAPSARADLSDIINAIGVSDSTGQTDFAEASLLLSGGDVPGALGYSLIGLDNYLVGPGYDVLLNGYDTLIGENGSYFATVFGPLPTPTDLAETFTDVANLVTNAQQDFAGASADFAADNIFIGLADLNTGGVALTESWQVGLVGLTDALLNSFLLPE